MDTIQTFMSSIGLSNEFLMKIVWTIVVIIGVMIISKIIANLVGGLIRKANFIKTAFKTVHVELDMKQIGNIVSKILFYILLLVGIIGGLSYGGVLSDTSLNGLINNYLMNLLNAVGLALLAWFLAVLTKAAIMKGSKMLEIDKKLLDKDSDIELSQTVATVGYWAVIIFFLPQILAKLNQEELLKPITNIIHNITDYIPNIIGAALIFIIGYYIAKVVKQITTSVLKSVGADKATKKLGLEDFSISKLAGTLVYIVILLPVAIQALDKLEIEVISGPATGMLQTMIDTIPLLLTASLIVVVSFFIGKFISKLVSELLTGIGFDKVLSLIGLKNIKSETKPSEVVGTIIFSYILLLASVEAASTVGFAGISGIVENILVFATNILIGVVILGIGMYIAKLAEKIIKSTSSSKILPMVAKSAIIVLTGFMGLKQMGIGGEIVDQAFTLIIGAMAVAFALAVGLGSKEVAGEEMKRIIENLRK